MSPHQSRVLSLVQELGIPATAAFLNMTHVAVSCVLIRIRKNGGQTARFKPGPAKGFRPQEMMESPSVLSDFSLAEWIDDKMLADVYEEMTSVKVGIRGARIG